MNIRWIAVLTGFLVDYLISLFVAILATPEFFVSPDLSQPNDLILICLLLLSTGIGGYVAGRMARTNRVLNGFLVAVVGILFGQLGGPAPRAFVVASAISCLVAALGGYLSRYPPPRQQRSSGQR